MRQRRRKLLWGLLIGAAFLCITGLAFKYVSAGMVHQSASSDTCTPVTRFLISFCFVLLLCTQPRNAQSGATPLALAPGSPAGSYHLSDIDTVNLFNGRVSIRMPIVTAQGRGDAVGPIMFNSGSPANWHVGADVDGNGQPIYYAEPGGGGAVSVDGLTMGLAQVYGVQAGSQTRRESFQ